MDVGFIVRDADGKPCSGVYAAQSAAVDYANWLRQSYTPKARGISEVFDESALSEAEPTSGLSAVAHAS